jgi:hypothetical protein
MKISSLLDGPVLQESSSSTKTALTNINHRLKMKTKNQISKFQQTKVGLVNQVARKLARLK